MEWWYELRGSDRPTCHFSQVCDHMFLTNRLLEIRRGFANRQEAEEAGKRAKQKSIAILHPIRVEEITVKTQNTAEPAH